MSIEKFVEEFPQNFQTSNPNVAVSFFPNDVCNAEEDKGEIGNEKPVLVAIFSDPEIVVTVDDKDGSPPMFVGYTVYQSPSQADEASLASYFGDATEEEENGIVSTSLGPCSMMIDSVPVCPGSLPFWCDGKYHGCLPKYDLPIVDKFGGCAKFIASSFFKNKDKGNFDIFNPPPPPPPTPCPKGKCCGWKCPFLAAYEDACLPASGTYGGVNTPITCSQVYDGQEKRFETCYYLSGGTKNDVQNCWTKSYRPINSALWYQCVPHNLNNLALYFVAGGISGTCGPPCQDIHKAEPGASIN